MRSSTFLPIATLVATTACLVLSSGASAQIALTSRTSTIRYGWVHGGGPDVHSGDVLNTYTDLLVSDVQGANFSDATAGQWFDHSWDTSVHCLIGSGYVVTGPLGSATRLQNAQSTLVEAMASGDIGVASMQSNNPGNENQFTFRAVRPSEYHLTGSIVGGSSAFTYLTLQRFNGFNWDTMFVSYSIQGSDIVWDVQGTLIPGVDYRLISAIDNSANANTSHLKTLDYDFKVHRQLTFLPGVRR